MKIPSVVNVTLLDGSLDVYNKVDNFNILESGVIAIEQGDSTTIIPLARIEKIEATGFKYL